MLEVCDRLLAAAEPVGRALPGVALVRAVRCLDGPLDLTYQLSLARSGAGTEMRWCSLNRFVFGYFVDRKLTVDGGEVSVQQAQVCLARLGVVQCATTWPTVKVREQLREQLRDLVPVHAASRTGVTECFAVECCHPA